MAHGKIFGGEREITAHGNIFGDKKILAAHGKFFGGEKNFIGAQGKKSSEANHSA
ncbi:MAG: hypothetical protein IKO05_05660 [Selenomonadaceae bacterium]|nr:hypothetical protein [Selenomonadaceae bacterium]